EDVRNALAALSEDERKKYERNLEQIVMSQSRRVSRAINPIGLKNIADRKINKAAPDVIPVAAINPVGDRVIFTVNYQEGQIPTEGASQGKKTSNLYRAPMRQESRGITIQDQVAGSFKKRFPSAGDKASRSFLSYSRSAVTLAPALQSGDNDSDGLP